MFLGWSHLESGFGLYTDDKGMPRETVLVMLGLLFISLIGLGTDGT